MNWLHHLIFDPMSDWERFKVGVILLPFEVLLFLAVACFFTRKGKTR